MDVNYVFGGFNLLDVCFSFTLYGSNLNLKFLKMRTKFQNILTFIMQQVHKMFPLNMKSPYLFQYTTYPKQMTHLPMGLVIPNLNLMNKVS
jgi:hypothetical protein